MTFVVKADATSGTWLIDDETVEIRDMTLIHEGMIIIRGSGQLILVNSTLRLKQVTSWQFSIKLQESAVFSMVDSQLATVYPYRVDLEGSSALLADSSSAPFISVHMEDTTHLVCNNSSFLDIVAGASSEVELTGCRAEHVVATMDCRLFASTCGLSALHCRQLSIAAVENTTIDTLLLDDKATVDVNYSELGEAWCWFSSNLTIRSCEITTLQYYDTASVTVSDSAVDNLVGAGTASVELNSLTIREVKLTGWANVSLTRCISDSIYCDWHSTSRFSEGSCNYIELLDWADMSIIGTPSTMCNVTELGAYADTRLHIEWTNFHTINLGHRTRMWMNNSSAYTVQSFAYAGTSLLYISQCEVEWELRLSWGVAGEIRDSIAANVLVYGDSAINATGCEFLAIAIGDVDDAFIRNCSIGGLFPGGEARITVVESNVCFGIQPDPHTSSVFGWLPSGYVDNWNALESGAIAGLLWNITVMESMVSWKTAIRYDAVVELRNSILTNIACGETSTTIIQNVSADQMTVSNSANVVMSGGTISDLDCGLWSTSIFENVGFVDVFTIDYAEATLKSCTIEYSLAGGSSMPRFENCTIGQLRASGGSICYILDSSIQTFYSYDSSVNSCHNSTILDMLSCYHISRLKLHGCNVSLLSIGNSAVVQVEVCLIGSLLTQASAQTTCVDSSIEELDCRDFSVIFLLGNFTGLTSYSIAQSGGITRQIAVIVTDSVGEGIEGATVEVYNELDQLIVKLQTDSNGYIEFEILFVAVNSTLLQSFSFNVSKDGSTSHRQFLVTDSMPIRITLESPLAPTMLPESKHSPAIPSDEEPSEASEIMSAIEFIIFVQSCAMVTILLPMPVLFLMTRKWCILAVENSKMFRIITRRFDK
jgi:hypothetical protein